MDWGVIRVANTLVEEKIHRRKKLRKKTVRDSAVSIPINVLYEQRETSSKPYKRQ